MTSTTITSTQENTITLARSEVMSFAQAPQSVRQIEMVFDVNGWLNATGGDGRVKPPHALDGDETTAGTRVDALETQSSAVSEKLSALKAAWLIYKGTALGTSEAEHKAQVRAALVALFDSTTPNTSQNDSSAPDDEKTYAVFIDQAKVDAFMTTDGKYAANVFTSAQTMEVLDAAADAGWFTEHPDPQGDASGEGYVWNIAPGDRLAVTLVVVDDDSTGGSSPSQDRWLIQLIQSA